MSALVGVVTASLLSPVVALAAPGGSLPGVVEKSAPLSPVKSKTMQVAPMPQWAAKQVAWPAVGAAEADVPASAPAVAAAPALKSAALAGPAAVAPGASLARVGSSPFSVGAVADAGGSRLRSMSASLSPSRVRVAVVDPAVAAKAQVQGVLFTVARADGVAQSGQVNLDLDYSGFAGAFGGDFGARLHLVAMPGCILSTPEVAACRTQTPVVFRNDSGTGHASGSVDAAAASGPATSSLGKAAPMAPAAAPMVYAATSTSSSPQGTWTATPLSPAGSWASGNQAGDFTYQVPMRVPPSLGGLAPDLALSYSSQSTDTHTLATSSQTSWVGEGWDMTQGFVERQYQSCKVQGRPNPGDLCYNSDQVTVNLKGHSTKIIVDDSTHVWKLVDDDGSKIDRLFGAPNGDAVGEYWRITAVDGTQYYFGAGARPGSGDTTDVTASAWTVPVWSGQTYNSCYNATYVNSKCFRAWRWNLDYVVDPRGNSMSLFYQREGNWYGAYNGTIMYWETRAGNLTRIEYGTKKGEENQGSPMRVLFGLDERCLSNCSGHTENYPDTPWDQQCGTLIGSPPSSCPNLTSPVFWSQRRLSTVTTQIWDPALANYRSVDTWTLQQSFPDPGDGTAPSLWLGGVQHTGNVGGTASDPTLWFNGTVYANRVDYNTSASVPPLNKYRIRKVIPSTGATTSVNYLANTAALGGCDPATIPTGNADTNWRRCFPQYFTLDPKNLVNGTGWGWFHKYVVSTVVDSDANGGGVDETWAYQYDAAGSSSTAMWHYDDNYTSLPAYRSWNQWRGYPQVEVWHGTGSAVVYSTKRYYRGMDGDQLITGPNARRVTMTDSQGDSDVDSLEKAGRVREEYSYDNSGPTPMPIASTFHYPQVTATGYQSVFGPYAANQVREARTTSNTRLIAAGTWRTTEVDNTFDTYGLLTDVKDLGDTARTDQRRCTHTDYARNTGTYLINYPSQTVTTDCNGATVSGSQTLYDGTTTVGATPTQGLATKTTTLATAIGTTLTWAQATRAGYDEYGRTTATYDALDRKSTTAFTPAHGQPVTSVTTTNPMMFTASSTLEAGWGKPTAATDVNGKTSTARYDPLGRITRVWSGNRPTTATANLAYTYHFPVCNTDGIGATTCDSVPWVKTTKLAPNGNTNDGYALYDGRLRARQTQTLTQDGKRAFTDQAYDAAGRVWLTNSYKADGAPNGTLYGTWDINVAQQHVITFDTLGRATADTLRSYGTQVSQTSTAYDGDRTTITPPAGGTATTAFTDARGKIATLRQYLGSAPTGASQDTTYGYDLLGHQTAVKDVAGNTWTTGYDLRNRITSKTDPDTGTSSSTYDDAGQLLTSTDSRGVKLTFSYDNLGRKTQVVNAGGTKLASWTYDTLAKGMPTSSTKFEGADSYVSAVTGYDSGYRPLGTSVTIPASAGTLAGTYTSGATYKDDGSPATLTYPAAGSLPAETVTSGYTDTGYAVTAIGQDNYLSWADYNYHGVLQQQTMGVNGKRVVVTTTHDDATGRLTSTELDTEPTPNVWEQKYTETYGYDPAGNVKSIAETTGSTAVTAQCFSYDGLRRMTEAWATGATGCQATPSQAVVGGPDSYWTSYTFDKVGSRTTDTKHNTGGNTTRTYATPTAGAAQPHSLTKVTVGGTNTDQYTYDLAGNTLSHNNASYRWNDLGKLASTTITGGATTSYIYDADGNRLLRKDSTGITAYLPGQELHATSLVNVPTCTRMYGSGTTTIAARSTSSGLTWLVSDHHDTGQTSINSTTLAVTRRRTDPFGAVRGTPAVWPTEHGFVNGVNDPDAGLTHIGARDYDPTTGRFISVDPILDPTDPQTMNGYAYSHGNPVTNSDPTGLYEEDDTGNAHPIGNSDSPRSRHNDCNEGACAGGQITQREYTWLWQQEDEAAAQKRQSAAERQQQTIVRKLDEAARLRQQKAAEQKKKDELARQADLAKRHQRSKDNSIFGLQSFGVCVGAGAAFYMGMSGSGCIGVDANGIGGLGTKNTTAGPNVSVFAGAGLMLSNGNLDDQAGPFQSVGGGAGDAVSVDGSLAWGSGTQGQSVWSFQGLLGLGAGAGGAYGRSETYVSRWLSW